MKKHYLLRMLWSFTCAATLAVALGVAAPAAQAASASIFNAWWDVADNDQDGCVAPRTASGGLRLYWDADVNGVETLSIYEKIYVRTTPAAEWELIATNGVHAITANSPADAQFIEIAPGENCATRDYRVEVYLAIDDTLQDARDPLNDADLNAHKEELFAQDLPATKIYDANWSLLSDRDQDGCFAPQTAMGGIRLHWDADVVGPVSSSVSVFERIYARPVEGGKWNLVATTTPHVITGNSTTDAQFIDIVPEGACAELDYKIELYREGMSQPDYIRDPSNDTDMANRKVESYLHDTGPVIADAWWSNVVDSGLDGCFAPTTPGGLLRLHWDPNVAGGGSLAVTERIYYRTSSAEDWVLLHTTSRHTITGTMSTDAQYVDIEPGSNCEARDYKIELYRAELDEPADVRDGSKDPDLAAHKEQTFAQDNAQASLADAWWSNTADRDGDGCIAPAASTAYFLLMWNPEAPAGVTLTVYEKIWWRNTGAESWNLAMTTQPHVITGTSTNDIQALNMIPGGGCAAYDYRIEVLRHGQETPDAALDSGTDTDLSAHMEETWAEDNLLASINGVWWSNISDADQDGCVSPEDTGTPVLHWNPDVVNGSTLTVYERVSRRATGTPDWNVVYVSTPYEISGLGTNDSRSFAVPEEVDCAPMDYLIELVRFGQSAPDFVADPSNEPLLGDRRQETKAQDAAKAIVASVWWNGLTDHDGDGCFAPATRTAPIELRWNPDYPGTASGLVYGVVYSRTSGSGPWTAVATNSPALITGNDTNDAQSVVIPAPSECTSMDFLVELYRPGGSLPDSTRGPEDDAALREQQLESYLHDNLIAIITDVWWTRIADHDEDTCFAPDNRTNRVRLNWTSAVSSPGSLPVHEKVYARPTGTTNWVLMATNALHQAQGEGDNPTQFIEFVPPGGCAVSDYLIEIYTLGNQAPDTTLGPDEDADLAAQKSELYEQDNIVARLNNTWWSSFQDVDGDGCVAPTNANAGMRLHWDPDISGDGSLIVFERVYRRVAGGNWVLLVQSADHALSGSTANDATSVEVPVPNTCSPVDYRIELYRKGATEPDSVRDYSNDSWLSQHSEESFVNDTQATTGFIGRVWWSNTMDNDGDGCVAPSQPNGYLRLHWDPDAAANTSVTIYEKVYWRGSPQADWLAVYTTPTHVVTGTNQADAQFADVLPGSDCATSEYRIEIYRPGAVLPDDVIDPTESPLLAQREETFAQDPGVAPEITLQPASQTVPPGTTVNLQVEATGTRPLNYQWYRGASALTGETNSTLVLLKVQAEDAGDYTVVLSNIFGSRTSGVAKVAIRSATPVRLEAPGFAVDGHFQFRIMGDAGAVLQVEHSVGLSSWEPLASITNVTGTVTFKDPSTSTERRFYRVTEPQ